MAIRTAKNDPWHDEDFQPSAGPANSADQFAQPDSRGLGLRPFINRELTRSASVFETATSETLAPGIYLRRQAGSGDWELLVRHTRGSFLAYYAETREELLAIAEQKIGERNGNRNTDR